MTWSDLRRTRPAAVLVPQRSCHERIDQPVPIVLIVPHPDALDALALASGYLTPENAHAGKVRQKIRQYVVLSLSNYVLG